jgi:hypothetical protein
MFYGNHLCLNFSASFFPSASMYMNKQKRLRKKDETNMETMMISVDNFFPYDVYFGRKKNERNDVFSAFL